MPLRCDLIVSCCRRSVAAPAPTLEATIERIALVERVVILERQLRSLTNLVTEREEQRV